MTSHPTTVSELPPGEFYAILRPESTTVPGDERSRTHPGHGYPEHSVDYWKIEAFPNREAWEAEIKRLSASVYYRQEWKAVIIKPAKITTTLSVEVK